MWDRTVRALPMQHCLRQRTRALTFRTANCDGVTDEALSALAESCPDIEQVDFRGCSNLTDAAVIALTAKCTSSKIQQLFKADGCSFGSVCGQVLQVTPYKRLDLNDFNGQPASFYGFSFQMQVCPLLNFRQRSAQDGGRTLGTTIGRHLSSR